MLSLLWGHPYITSAHFCTFSDPPTQYISKNTVLNVSKNCHFLNPPTYPPSPFADVIYSILHIMFKKNDQEKSDANRKRRLATLVY